MAETSIFYKRIHDLPDEWLCPEDIERLLAVRNADKDLQNYARMGVFSTKMARRNNKGPVRKHYRLVRTEEQIKASSGKHIKCLGCQNLFKSAGKYNRLCNKCVP